MVPYFLQLSIAFLVCGGVRADQCPQGEPVSYFNVDDEDDASVFDDLTTSDIKKVYDYMKSRPEFDVKEGDKVTMDSTYIYFMDRHDPTKSEVLDYIDNNGAKPGRFARVIMYRGDLSTPIIEEYKVGPLPNIESHTKLSIAGNEFVDYIKRHVYAPADMVAWDKVIGREIARVERYLQRVTGYRFNNCSDKCLQWFPGTPGRYKGNDRSMWVFFVRKVEGLFLHPIGLQFRIDTKGSLNIDEWTVDYVWFRGTVYTDMDDMANDMVTHISQDPEVDAESKNLFSSLNHRGDPLPEKQARGPRSYMPDGRRYTVEKHHVSWQGWSFDFNLRSLLGLQVHDLRFKKERMAYELSMSEIGIVYSGASPSPTHSVYVDSAFYLGLESYELMPGVDCPEHATFFDFAHFLNFKPIIFKNSACLFEIDNGVPLRHHYSSDQAGGFHYIQGMPGNTLVLRAIVTVHNYEYILDYIFHQNGVVEVRTSLSGYILSSYYTGPPTDDNRGVKVGPDARGNIHNHLVHYKVDLDVGQLKNRFETLDIQIENVPDPTDPPNRMNVQMFKRNLRHTEKNATYKYNFDTPKYLVFYNNDAENKYGNKKGVRLLPVGFTKQLLPENWAVDKGISWARYQVAVTKQKDSEARASSVYNVADNVDPTVNFQSFIDDNESIVDEDLVAWVSLGTFHIPHSEDIPIVTTAGHYVAYYLFPYNYFDEDPSLASRDNVRVTPAEGGTAQYEYVGVSPEVSCEPAPLAQKRSTSAAPSLRLSAILLITVLSAVHCC